MSEPTVEDLKLKLEEMRIILKMKHELIVILEQQRDHAITAKEDAFQELEDMTDALQRVVKERDELKKELGR